MSGTDCGPNQGANCESEIKVTPEMIKAGIDAYVDFFVPIVEGYEDAASAMVVAVFRAMSKKISRAGG